MQPLGQKTDKKNEESVSTSVHGSGRLVLPRFLRRPARYLARIGRGPFHLSTIHLGIAAALVLAAASGFGAYHWVGPQKFSAMIPQSPLQASQYEITGNKRVSEVEIIAHLAGLADSSMLFYDVAKARKSLKSNPWIADAVVKKAYPNKLKIAIVERQPFAIWQHEEMTMLVDFKGNVLANYSGSEELPLVVGQGAQKHAAGILAAIARHDALSARVRAFIRVGDRRWDLQLDSGANILLPETGYEAALRYLDELDRQENLFGKAFSQIDMRLKDRISFRVASGAASSMRWRNKTRFESVMKKRLGDRI